MSKASFFAGAIVLALLGGIGWWLVSGDNHSAQSAPSPVPAVTASASAAADPFRVTTPTDFSKRVLDFEEAYRMRARPDGLARLAPFATDRYMQDHTPPPGGKYALPSSNTVVTVSRDLSKTQLKVTKNGQDPNVRYVEVIPFVSTSEVQPDNSLKAIDQPHSGVEIHATTWRLVNGIWKVDQER